LIDKASVAGMYINNMSMLIAWKMRFKASPVIKIETRMINIVRRMCEAWRILESVCTELMAWTDDKRVTDGV
jgi:hypothetical protein